MLTELSPSEKEIMKSVTDEHIESSKYGANNENETHINTGEIACRIQKQLLQRLNFKRSKRDIKVCMLKIKQELKLDNISVSVGDSDQSVINGSAPIKRTNPLKSKNTKERSNSPKHRSNSPKHRSVSRMSCFSV